MTEVSLIEISWMKVILTEKARTKRQPATQSAEVRLTEASLIEINLTKVDQFIDVGLAKISLIEIS